MLLGRGEFPAGLKQKIPGPVLDRAVGAGRARSAPDALHLAELPRRVGGPSSVEVANGAEIVAAFAIHAWVLVVNLAAWGTAWKAAVAGAAAG